MTLKPSTQTLEEQSLTKLEEVAQLIYEARWVEGLDEEARCGLLRQAIKVLMREKTSARRRAKKLSLHSTTDTDKLEALLDELLDHPSQRLAVYGTLAPGKTNHHVIAEIQGTWDRGWIRGVLGRIGPYPACRWKPHAMRIPVQVLSSSRLLDHWERLDRFEGTAYRRILAPVTNAGGRVHVANLYEGVVLS